MTTSIRKVLKPIVFTLFIVSLLLTVAAASGQERASVQKKEPVEMKRATVQSLQVSPDASVDALRSSIERCGQPCRMGGSGDVVAPGGGTLDYNCDEDGNCACFGAADCVAMTEICNKDTLGCNKQGCICEKGD